MVDFFRAGGVGMFVVLVFGAICLGVGALFLIKPDPKKLGFLRAMSVTTLFSVGVAVASDLAAVCSQVPNHPEWSKSPEIHLIIMTGIGESLTPAILGLAMLTLTWMLIAFGIRRSDLDERLA
ncbi:MAG: hypothetical protein H6729_08250 [Deltaproteobacteria bacterium]|nr:hypothetical protein [Deltaproteobacteria bacterium]